MYDEKGRLTRAGAEQVIRSGGSVSIGGQIITQAANLPGEAEFARGDTKAEDAARERLRQQAADIQRQLAALGTGGGQSGPVLQGDKGATPASDVRTITGADFGPRPVRATNADAFPQAGAAAEADAAADKADADDDARARKGKGRQAAPAGIIRPC